MVKVVMGKTESQTVTVLLAIIIIVGGFSPSQLVLAAADGNIHGTVVDENGEPIYRVKVTATTQTGGVEDAKYTNEDGYFRMNLGGSYTLVFEKEGYVTEERSVQVTTAPTDNPDNDAVKMGEIVLVPTLALSSTVVKRVTSPGNTLQLTFTITNRGDDTEDVVFSVSEPEGWKTRVLDSMGEIESVLLSPGNENFILEIKVPLTASEVTTVSLNATGSSQAQLCFTITPRVSEQDIELKSTYMSISEELGQSISLPLSVSNVGEVDKTVSLQHEAPEGWSLSFRTASDMVVKTLLLTSGETENLNIELEPPEDAAIGDYNIVVKAVVDGVVFDSLGFEVNLREAVSELEVISSYSEVTVEAGSSITFPIAIWNKGEKDALALLVVPTAPSNWRTTFISDDIEVSSILVEAGESTTVKLQVTPPNSVETGSYELVALIGAGDGSQTHLPFVINVAGSYELSLSLSTLYTSVNIGGSLTYTARVTNNGQTPVTTLYLEAVIPDDWEATITPAQVSTLAARESVTFTVEVDTPSDTVAGDYLLAMKAYSDQLESDEIDLRVTAKASTSWGVIGLGVAAVAIAGAAYMFRRFKRR
jgi:uncharacterized membrane protein